MTRLRQPDYAGAIGRLDLAGASALRGYSWQPKVDGCYCEVATDAGGRICLITSRTGAELREGRELYGQRIAPGRSVYAGELEAHTEAGIAAARARGWRQVHLFDALHDGTRPLSALPYAVRRDVLYRQRTVVQDTPTSDAPVSGCSVVVARVERDGVDTMAAHMDDDPGRGRSGIQWRVRWDNNGRLGQRTFGSELAARKFALRLDARSGGPKRNGVGQYYTAGKDWRVAPIVQQWGPGLLEQAWSEYVVAGGGEGLVAVHPDAPLGRRGAKRKIKATDTIDGRVLSVDGGLCDFMHRGRRIIVSARGAWGRAVVPGDVVEVLCDGYYASGDPRFARIRRIRYDLAA